MKTDRTPPPAPVLPLRIERWARSHVDFLERLMLLDESMSHEPGRLEIHYHEGRPRMIRRVASRDIKVPNASQADVSDGSSRKPA